MWLKLPFLSTAELASLAMGSGAGAEEHKSLFNCEEPSHLPPNQPQLFLTDERASDRPFILKIQPVKFPINSMNIPPVFNI